MTRLGNKATRYLTKIATKEGMADKINTFTRAYENYLRAQLKSYEDLKQALQETFGKSSNEISRLIADIGKIKYYYPRVREGNTIISVYQKVRGEKKKVGNFHFNAWIRSTKLASPAIKRKMEELKEKYPPEEGFTFEVFEKKESNLYQNLSTTDRDVIQSLINKIYDKVSETSPELSKSIKEAMTEDFVAFFKKKVGFTRGMKRKKETIVGYETENAHVRLVESLKSTANFVTRLRLSQDIQDALEFVDKNHTRELNTVVKYAKSITSNANRIDHVVGFFNKLAFTAHIAGAIGSSLLNLTSLPINTYWTAGATFGGVNSSNMVRVTKVFITAMNNAFKLMKYADVPGLPKSKISLINPKDWMAIHKDSGVGLDVITAVHHFLFTQSAKSYRTAAIMEEYQGVTDSNYKKFIDVMAVPFAGTEIFNRISTFLVGNELFMQDYIKEHGPTPSEETAARDVVSEAFEAGRNLVDATQGVYARNNYPLWLSGGDTLSSVARAGYIFKHYTMTTFQLWENQIQKNPKEGMKLIAGALSTMVALGGIRSIPVLGFITNLISKAFGTEPEKKMNEFFGDLLYRGLPTGLGVDMSGSLSMGIPFVNRFGKETDSPSLAIVSELFPIPVRMFDDFFGVIVPAFFHGEWGDVLEKGSPYVGSAIAGNAIKAWRYSTEGVTTRSGKQYMNDNVPYTLTVYDGILKALGIQPEAWAKFWTEENEVRQRDQYMNAKKSRIYKEIRLSNGVTPEMLKDILAHNYDVGTRGYDYKTTKKYLITPSSISRTLNTRFKEHE